MATIIPSLTTVGFATALLVVTLRGEINAAKPSVNPDELTAKSSELVREMMEREGVPGLSLAVIRDGQVLLAKGYGLANFEQDTPATLETIYQIQSMTKSFTATGLMMLVEEEKLSVDDKVSTYLEGTPESWKDINIRHLLTHTSGIKDFINDPTASLRLDVTEGEVFKATAPRALNFQPGERYAYSNTNYHLLAMIIRKLTGKPYGEFLRERIFAPLGMTDTAVVNWAEIIPRRAAGYRMMAEGLRNGDYVAPSILGYGGGGLRSTVLDLVKWDAALSTEELLRKSTLEQMWTPAKLNNGKATNYGFGWEVQSFGGHRCISHGGAHVTGFRSTIIRFVDDRITVIVLANSLSANVESLARRIAALFLPGVAPKTWQPIEDHEPQLAARVQALFAHWLGGERDSTGLTPELDKQLSPRIIHDAAETFGRLQSLVLVERTEDHDRRRSRYLASFPHQRAIVVIELDQEDRFAELRIEPE